MQTKLKLILATSALLLFSACQTSSHQKVSYGEATDNSMTSFSTYQKPEPVKTATVKSKTKHSAKKLKVAKKPGKTKKADDDDFGLYTPKNIKKKDRRILTAGEGERFGTAFD